MKKILITLAIIIGLVIAALLVIPTFFKEDILRLVQKQSSKYINADLTIEDISLNMFKSFPSLNATIKNVAIIGKDEFSKDTVAFIPLFEASINLKSLISGNTIIINKILLENAALSAVVSPSGKANWDIFISDTTAAAPSAPTRQDEETGKDIRFNDISVKNLHIDYNDYQKSTYAYIDDMNLKLSGNFSEDNTLVDLLLELNNISLRQQNSIWVNNTNFKWQAEIGANLKEMIFDIKKNDMALNDLKLDMTGNVKALKDKYSIDLKLNAPETKFESLLALVPKEFQKHMEGLKTDGDFNLIVTAKGDYYENILPAFNALFAVRNASVKYPDLPESIEKINIDLNISNPGGIIDSTLLDLKQMSFSIANNPFNMYVKLRNFSDPAFMGGAKGVINFASLKKALPLQDITLQGIITTDINVNGKYEYIEKQQYEKFTAKGDIILKDILFKNTEFPQGISVPKGSIIVTPAKLNLNDLQAKIYSSSFTLQGNISNYLPYLLRDEVLRANFSLTSPMINLNEFTTPATTDTTKQKPAGTTTTAQADTTGNVLEIPKNINIQLSTNINTILFDNLSIRNVKGNINLANAIASLNNLSMDMLNGTMVMNGKYNSVNPSAPKIDFHLNVSNFDINAVYNSFSFIKKSIPIAMNCNGRISSTMNFNATLDKNMSPVMKTANGDGFISSQGILINDNPAMNQLANVLKNDELSRLSISNLKIDFKLENGNIIIAPFKTTFAGNPVTISGKQSVEGDLDYTLSINLNRKYFGKDINNLLSAIPGSNNIQNLDIDAKIGGTLAKPEIKPDLSKAIKTVSKEAEKELKNKAKDGIMKGLENLFK